MGPAGLSARRPPGRLLARDAIAGLTVGLVLIPQSLAYADVAGMPPVAGLYAASLPLLVAALFASSPYLQTGPVAMTALLTFGALAGRAPVGSPEYLQLGLLLALVVGVVRVAIGLARGGLVAHLLSEPMLIGFMPAAALLIVASQVPAALGAATDAGVVGGAVEAVADPAGWSAATIALAAGSLAFVLAVKRIHRLFPGVLVVLVAGVAAGGALGGEVATIGSIPTGLPRLDLDLPYGELPGLIVPGAIIAVVGFSEAASISRTYATRERQRWDANRELLGQGAANLVAGATGGFPVGGSLSRSALNHGAGAATRFSGAVTGLVVLALLPFASILEPLPRAVLAAIVISTVVPLLRLGRIATLWRISRPQFVVAATTFAVTLAVSPHVEIGIVVGVALSVVVHLGRELSLRIASEVDGDALVVRPAGVLWFATADGLAESIGDLLGRYPGATRLRLDLGGLGRIDLTGAMALERVLDDVRSAGVEVELSGVPAHARALMTRYGTRRSEL